MRSGEVEKEILLVDRYLYLVSGAKKPTSVTGENARSTGNTVRGRAVRLDSPSKDAADELAKQAEPQ